MTELTLPLQSRSRPPHAYGYLPEEREVIAEIIRLRREGYGYWRIAAHLNDAGIPAKRGGRWHYSTVHRILAAEVPELCPPRDTSAVPQDQASTHHRDLDRRRKARAARRSEQAA